MDSVDAYANIEYTWAQNNLLSSVVVHDGVVPKTVSYAYSTDNLLQSRTEGTSTDQFIWDTNRQIPAMLSDGKFEYIYSKDRTPIAQIEILTGVTTYLHKDLTGSVTASTDTSGGLVGTVDYSPYGVATGSLLSRFGYAGEWVDKTTGYIYLKARWLDTKTGNFLSEDPLVQMTNNAFGYTEGNPITQIDPLGLFSLNDVGMFIWRNSGIISAGLSVASLGAYATIEGAPVGILLNLAAVVFSGAALLYDVGNCVGYIKDAACNEVSIILDILGLTTGGFGQLMGSGGKILSATAMTGQFSLNAASFLVGFIGATMQIGSYAGTPNNTTKQTINTTNEEECK